MKLVQKIRLFFYPTIIMTILLIVFFSTVVLNGYLSVVYGVEKTGDGFFEFLNPLSLQNQLVQKTYNQLMDQAQNDPDLLKSRDYLEKVNQKLDATESFLVMKLNEKIAFRGDDVRCEEIENCLFSYPVNEQEGRYVSLYVSEPKDFLIRQISFTTSSRDKGAVYILSDLDASMKYYGKILIYLILIGVFMVLFTSICISKFIKSQILVPLQILGEGIDKMKKGNLEEDVPIVRNDEIGEVAQSFNEMRDKLKQSIDDRLRYEEENKILISNVSHDLKTPITAIKGYVEGIIDGVATTPEMIDRYLKTVYTKAEMMDTMIDELSIYSKIDSNSIPYQFARLNLDSFFQDFMEDVSIDFENRNIEIAYFNYCSDDLYVMADAEQLKRVITNIVTNAVKYNDKSKGRINIRIREYGKDIRVEIEDNGMGIDEKDLPYIFDRLYRADTSRNSRSGGTGLGLSIAKKIIEEHGGRIWAKSRKNTGTMIIFTLEKEGENGEAEKDTDY